MSAWYEETRNYPDTWSWTAPRGGTDEADEFYKAVYRAKRALYKADKRIVRAEAKHLLFFLLELQGFRKCAFPTCKQLQVTCFSIDKNYDLLQEVQEQFPDILYAEKRGAKSGGRRRNSYYVTPLHRWPDKVVQALENDSPFAQRNTPTTGTLEPVAHRQPERKARSVPTAGTQGLDTPTTGTQSTPITGTQRPVAYRPPEHYMGTTNGCPSNGSVKATKREEIREVGEGSLQNVKNPPCDRCGAPISAFEFGGKWYCTAECYAGKTKPPARTTSGPVTPAAILKCVSCGNPCSESHSTWYNNALYCDPCYDKLEDTDDE